jgi:prepilin-type N-terminal cleavage/methylation domain-containing protein
MKLVSRQAFTVLELLVTIAVIGIVSSLVIRSTYNYLQEQHLRQAANDLVSYLITARARALREANVSGKACELQLNASTKTVGPTSQSANICNDSPSLPPLDLLVSSGSSDLTIDSSDGASPYYITFTRFGTVASSNLSSTASVTLPRIFYLSNKSATEMQRCVMVDLNSLLIGWRNNSTPTDSPCTLSLIHI